DSGSFLIYNKDHNKCVNVVTANVVQTAACDVSSDAQRFRWVSSSRIISVSLKLCLGAQDIKDWMKIILLPCTEHSPLQTWECKNETLFGLKDQALHLNYGNRQEPNMMLFSGSGGWSHWQIYGSQDDLCSHGYQEIYTLAGNSFGKPCQFPFKFNDKWFAECIVEGRSDGRLWCSTETDYDTDKKWGFCPTKGLTDHMGSVLWIGLNSLDFESGWQWSNGNPFRYLNWAPGHPSLEPGLNCAALNAAKASKWESLSCSKKLGYICRKGNSTEITPSTDVFVPLSADEETFTLQSELEAVDKQIQDLLEKQTWLREHPRTAAMTQPPPPVFEVPTSNRFAALCETECNAVVIGDSIVRNVRASSTKGKVRTHCFPGARVLDVSAQVPAILKDDVNVGAIVLDAGVNDVRMRQSEILKRDFRSLIETEHNALPTARIIISGPLLPTTRE
ncbi:putative macrophage mannose receptor 1, partial [Triplophysa rosa]